MYNTFRDFPKQVASMLLFLLLKRLFMILTLLIGYVFTENCYISHPPRAANVSKYCEHVLTCEVIGTNCDLNIHIKEHGAKKFIVIDHDFCTVTTNMISCKYTFTRNSTVQCVAGSHTSVNVSNPIMIQVQDHFDQVSDLAFNITDTSFKWQPPYTYFGILVQYFINLTYDNGTVIEENIVNDTSYAMPLIFDKCQYVNIEIMVVATCGNLSSKPNSWRKTVLAPKKIPMDNFNISLKNSTTGVSVYIAFPDDPYCPSQRSNSALLTCYYQWRKMNVTYDLQVVLKKGVDKVVQNNGDDIILINDDNAICDLFLINSARKTHQWRTNISTCSIQGFNFTSINTTDICMGCKLLESSSVKGCRITLENLQKQHDPYFYEILEEQQNEYILNQCLQSPPHNGYYHYSVSVIDSKGENVSNCTIKSFVNVTNSTDPSQHSSNKQVVVIVVGTVVSFAVIILLIVVALGIIMSRKKAVTHGTNERSVQTDSPAKLPLSTQVTDHQGTDSPSSTRLLVPHEDEPVIIYSSIGEQSSGGNIYDHNAIVTSVDWPIHMDEC